MPQEKLLQAWAQTLLLRLPCCPPLWLNPHYCCRWWSSAPGRSCCYATRRSCSPAGEMSTDACSLLCCSWSRIEWLILLAGTRATAGVVVMVSGKRAQGSAGGDGELEAVAIGAAGRGGACFLAQPHC
eukprot:648410-Pelagomonas_calceolata.AAC.8